MDIKEQIQLEKDNIQTIIDSRVSNGEKLVLLHDSLKWNIVSILDREIDRKKGMKKYVQLPEGYVNDNPNFDKVLNAEDMKCTILNQAIDEDIAYFTLLKERIK